MAYLAGMEPFLQSLLDFLPSGGVLFLMALLLVLNRWAFRRFEALQSDSDLLRHTVGTTVVLVGTLTFILSLPIERELKGQILSLLGIIISAAIALSSTTILGNLIAGLMNNAMDRFRPGDLVQVGETMGRVTRKSVFHTKLQLEDSNFVTIPNLHIATHPVKLTRRQNSVISTEVSLGYDVSRHEIEAALKEAAEEAGLTEPYVFIMSLGDFSVVYKVHGFLADSKTYFSSRSALNGQVMDALHQRGIEIMSPTFMNQRRIEGPAQIPPAKDSAATEPPEEKDAPENRFFDKAIESQELADQKDMLKQLDEREKQLRESIKAAKTDEEKATQRASLDRLSEVRKRIERSIASQEEKRED